MTNNQIIALILGFGFFSFILLLLLYGLTALCYQKIFKAYRYAHPGYAWIPFYRLYILADLTCDSTFKFADFEIEKKIFVWWWIIAYVIAYVPFVGGIVSFILNIICLGFCYDEGIKKLDPTYDSKVLSYVSTVLPIVFWFVVLPKKVD